MCTKLKSRITLNQPHIQLNLWKCFPTDFFLNKVNISIKNWSKLIILSIFPLLYSAFQSMPKKCSQSLHSAGYISAKKLSIHLQVVIYSQTKECWSRSSVLNHPPWLPPLQVLEISTDIQRNEKLSSTEALRSCMLTGIFKCYEETSKMLPPYIARSLLLLSQTR